MDVQMVDIEKVSVALNGEQVLALKAAGRCGRICHYQRDRA